MAASKPSAEQLITENIDVWSSAIKKRNSQGRGSSKKITLYGIKKLRELILELAVRGLLVPQNPNDESASVLLKKIAAEKEQLIKDKKIKKQKPLPPIGDDEKPFDLPNGWAWVRLQDLVTLLGDGLHGTPNYDERGEYFFVNGNNLKNGVITIKPDTKKVDVNEYRKYKKELNERTVLVSINGTLGSVAFYNNEPIMLGKSACYFNLMDGVDKLFFKRLLESPYFVSYAFSKATGGTIKNLGLKAMNNFPIALPPKSESSCIVAKVNELMALCDQLEQQTESSLTAHQTLVETLLNTLLTAAQTTGIKESSSQSNSNQESSFDQAWNRIAQHFDVLFTTEHSIDQLKQTILQLAVMGKLVPQDPNDEPASVLLEKIAAEKEQLIKDKKIKKQKPLPPIGDDEEPFELPQGWEWCNLQSLITIMDAGWSPACPPEPSPSNEIWGVLKTTAVQSMEYREYENKVLAANKEPRPQYEVKVGDILITRAGPKNRVGVSCLVQATRPKLMISDKVIRFHLVEMGMCERYLSLCLNAGATADYLDSTKSGMAESQMNISQDKLKAAPVPLAPAKEQFKIIKRVDELIALCDNLKAHISESQFTQLHLADAMAEQALN